MSASSRSTISPSGCSRRRLSLEPERRKAKSSSSRASSTRAPRYSTTTSARLHGKGAIVSSRPTPRPSSPWSCLVVAWSDAQPRAQGRRLRFGAPWHRHGSGQHGRNPLRSDSTQDKPDGVFPLPPIEQGPRRRLLGREVCPARSHHEAASRRLAPSGR